jgi:hypothetical protein
MTPDDISEFISFGFFIVDIVSQFIVVHRIILISNQD